MDNKSKIAGILSIVSGAFGLFGFFFLILISLALGISTDIISSEPAIIEVGGAEVIGIVQAVYAILGVLCLILGVLGIVGGVYSLRRRVWGLALAGAIASIFTFLPCGIAATVFVTMGHGEFLSSPPLVTPPQM